jgi:hypothetical protein
MGNFYTNFTVRSDDPQILATALKKKRRTAHVTPASSGWVVVFERDTEQNSDEIAKVGSLLSKTATGAVLAVMNHDNDILAYWLFEGGKLRDHYDSNPKYFEPTGFNPVDAFEMLKAGKLPEVKFEPKGGDAAVLCAACERPDATPTVDAILRNPDYVFASERHKLLVQALGLPESALGENYQSVEARSETEDQSFSDKHMRPSKEQLDFYDRLTQGFIDQGRMGAAMGTAAGAGHTRFLEARLAEGVSPDLSIESGHTALMVATSAGQVYAMTVLLDAGADPNAIHTDGSVTPLIMALTSPAPVNLRLALCKLLLDRGADPTLVTPKGLSAIHAVRQMPENHKVLKLLEEHTTAA